MMIKFSETKIFFLSVILFAGVFGVADLAFAETYWVSPVGAAANLAACSGSTPLEGTAACSYDKANTSGVVAGDAVYYRSGTYNGITGSAIDPYNTGAAGNVITFAAYNNEDVRFVGSGSSSVAVDLDSDYGTVRSYIKVHDLHFTEFMKHMWIVRGSHNEISHCSFIGYPAGATQANFAGTYGASYIKRDAQYNWIHHSTFGQWGYNTEHGYDTGVVFQVGLENSLVDITRYNLIENNEMYGGGHNVASVCGSYNIWRNNYIHNEPWYPLGAPVYSTRIMLTTGAAGNGQYNLVENNRIGYGGPKNKLEIGGAGVAFQGGKYGIWRRNSFVQIYTDANFFTAYAGQDDVAYNHVYNNIYWHGGYGTYQKYPDGVEPSTNWDEKYTHASVFLGDSVGERVYDNSVKNNIYYQNKDTIGNQYSILYRIYSGGWINRVPSAQDLAGNWLDNAGDPKFIDISGIPDPANGVYKMST